MKNIICSLLLLSSYSLANSFNEAEILEKNGKYKEAMEIYKKLAKENSIEENLKKEDSFTKIKNDFYNKNIDKTNNKKEDESIKQSFIGDFDLHPYRKTYFMPITYDMNNKDLKRKDYETEFQISLEKPFLYNIFGLEETFSIAYTQKSFWQTFENSAPFRENNYEPEAFVTIPTENEYLKKYKIAFNHQSNGKSGIISRSWNRVYLESVFQFDNLFVTPKIWYKIPESQSSDDNKNIQNYLGYGDLKFGYFYNKHLFELKVMNNLNFKGENRGSGELNWTFPLPFVENTRNVYGMVNIFSGYGNSLIDYDREIHKIGFGIALTR